MKIVIPKRVFEDPFIPPRAKLLYGWMFTWSKDRTLTASYSFLSAGMGVSDTYTIRLVKQLILRGYVTKVGQGADRENVYHLEVTE